MHYWKKLIAKGFIRKLSLYKKIYSQIIDEEKEDLLKQNLVRAVRDVPFYKRRYGHLGIDDLGIENFDIIRKAEVVQNETLFCSSKFWRKLLIESTTGGTSGVSLNLYKTLNAIIYETAYTDYAFSLIAKRSELKIALLRGERPQKGISEYRKGKLLLSSQALTRSTIEHYIELLNKHEINCLHVYPSSIHLFCKYMLEREDGCVIPKIIGILSSSEILSRDDKGLIMKIFPNATLVDLYGQKENVAMAVSINEGFYRFFKNFSFVELIKGENSANDRVAEIIGTSYSNAAMPLIRYATDDYAELDAENNVISIIGRSQDFLLNKDYEVVPSTYQRRSDTFVNVLNFQYFQDHPGVLEIRVVASKKFGKKDIALIKEDIINAFKNRLEPVVRIVDEIPRTVAGKQKRLIQELDINSFEARTGQKKPN